MVSDIAAAQPRTTPSYLPSQLANNLAIDQTLAAQGVGIVDIGSVYDLDGKIYTGITGINAVADPTSSGYATRPARFLRLEKAVSMPDKDVRNIDNSAFGASNFMRQILGFIPIEPDGSVRVEVPANVAFQISVLDANGRRLSDFSRHNAWLQVRPGETLQCNGCHVPAPQMQPGGPSGTSHGRKDAFNAAYAGAVTGGQTFANANATFTALNAGDTMARARAAWSCANEHCASITPSVNVIYSEVWTSGSDPHTLNQTPAPAANFSYVYTGQNGLFTTLPTAASPCATTWTSTCRIVINYLQHIQPLWDLARPANAQVTIDHTCTNCHSPLVANKAAVPAGQLDLTSSASTDPNAGVRVTSYQQLLFSHNAQQLNANMTALQDICLQTDPVTQVCTQFQTVNPLLAALNASGSPFFQVFTQGGVNGSFTVNHRNFLSPGELRLISEWVDIGAQYYNDPFAAPVN